MESTIPVAYKGSDPYIFISYAHKDSDTVLSVIARLKKMDIGSGTMRV